MFILREGFYFAGRFFCMLTRGILSVSHDDSCNWLKFDSSFKDRSNIVQTIKRYKALNKLGFKALKSGLRAFRIGDAEDGIAGSLLVQDKQQLLDFWAKKEDATWSENVRSGWLTESNVGQRHMQIQGIQWRLSLVLRSHSIYIPKNTL